MKKIWKYGKFGYESAKHLRKFAKRKFWKALRANYKSKKKKNGENEE
jgi:ribonuclease HII